MSIPRPSPLESIPDRPAIEPERPGFVVDLRRCIGCHACSVACKTAHDIPLGEFPLRVRWLPRPKQGPKAETFAFVPAFSESLCGGDPESLEAGLEPACARACPTDALIFGDFAERTRARAPESLPTVYADEHDLKRLSGPDLVDSKKDVLYIGLEAFVPDEIHQGAALDPRDADPIYEQR